MKKSVKFSPEVRERAVRMAGECRGDHPSQWAAVDPIAAKIGCTAQTLLSWARQHERGTGHQPPPIRSALRSLSARFVRRPPRQRDPDAGQRVVRPGAARAPIQVLRAVLDAHRDAVGVEPICQQRQIAPSGYRRHLALLRHPQRHRAEVFDGGLTLAADANLPGLPGAVFQLGD
jgi:transposase-like protein